MQPQSQAAASRKELVHSRYQNDLVSLVGAIVRPKTLLQGYSVEMTTEATTGGEALPMLREIDIESGQAVFPLEIVRTTEKASWWYVKQFTMDQVVDHFRVMEPTKRPLRYRAGGGGGA